MWETVRKPEWLITDAAVVTNPQTDFPGGVDLSRDFPVVFLNQSPNSSRTHLVFCNLRMTTTLESVMRHPNNDDGPR